jgi:hypothetical protein
MPSAGEELVRGPSSAGLIANVANFLERAELIARNRLAGQDAQFSVQMRLDPRTGEVSATGFDPQVLPEDDWLAMAVRMRPIIFLEDDPVSIKNLTSQIEREHQSLRGQLKDARTGLAAWKRHPFVYAGNLGGLPRSLGPDDNRRQWVKIGPAGASPSGVPLAGLSTDYDFANTYLNAMLWHSDTAKSIEYQAAPENIKQHYRKCAEIRVLSAAKDIIPPLREWILDARANGFKF